MLYYVYTREGVFILEGKRMAKESLNVDNGLEEIELTSREKMNKKKDKKEKKENKNVKEKKEKTAKKGNYFSQIRDEMKLVTWPTRKSVAKYSIAAIFMVALLAAFFVGISALFDLLYAFVQGWIG